jgi:dTDP-4-dehydrorhamnose reductase
VTRWLVTGAGGAVGSDLVDLLTAQEADVAARDHSALDVADSEALTAALEEIKPTVVLNAAAYTRVDDAETDEDTALRVNGEAPGVMARWCAEHRARMVHISTDYVFDGNAAAPYEVKDKTGPVSAYGRTKRAGERAVLAADGNVHVVRAAWIYGARGTNFVRTIARRLLAGEAVDVVDDQRGAPTWSRDLAAALIALGTADVRPGLWHCAPQGEVTWYGVAVAIAEELDCDPSLVRPTTSEAFVRPAPRPRYSVLSSRKWANYGLPVLPDWRESLHQALTVAREALTT